MCLFCDIIDGKIPSKKVYEDDNYLAILDIAQTTKGHTLVMSKKHSDTFLDMSNDEFKQLMSKVHEIAPKVINSLNAKGCNLLVNTNEVAGQTIMHTHVHIIPRYDDSDSININFVSNDYDLDEVLKTINEG